MIEYKRLNTKKLTNRKNLRMETASLFGYIMAEPEKLSDVDRQIYQRSYCSLCRALGRRYGTVGRIALSYDMAFLIILLDSIYCPETPVLSARCMVHPLSLHEYRLDEISSYAADMNIALAYFNLLDDWADNGSVLKLAEAKLLEGGYRRFSALHPSKNAVMEDCLSELSEVEISGVQNPDIPANCFGRLIGEVFAFRGDEYAEDLRSFGISLGRFIYILDACIDLRQDLRHKRYNPLLASPSEDFDSFLVLLMSDCTTKYGQLQVIRNKKIIENILYSGIWTKYEIHKAHRGSKKI